MKILNLFLTVILVSGLFSACSQNTAGIQDGYYTSETASLDAHGWKEFITIYVSNNRIVTVEYGAKNANGMLKAWDMDYMRVMDARCGTYPNKYSREYAIALVNKQDPDKVDAITGATHSYATFQSLAKAALVNAKSGDQTVAFVELSSFEDEKAEG